MYEIYKKVKDFFWSLNLCFLIIEKIESFQVLSKFIVKRKTVDLPSRIWFVKFKIKANGLAVISAQISQKDVVFSNFLLFYEFITMEFSYKI